MAKYEEKQWFKINAPESFEGKEIGETKAVSAEDAIGRTVKLSLPEITGEHSKQKMNVVFKIDGKEEDKKLTTKIVSCELEKRYIKRNLRRMKSLVEAITELDTKDDYKVKVKLLSFGKKPMTEKQEKEMREKMVRRLKKKAKKMDKTELFQQIIFGKLAAQIFKEVKGIYPIKRTEIAKTEVLEEP